jgi:serine/threonine-protein kinase RsbT
MNAQQIDGYDFTGRRMAELPGALVDMHVSVGSPGDVVAARRKGRAFSIALGFRSGEATIVATLLSELARQILRDDRRGEIILMAVHGVCSSGVIITTRREGRSAKDAASRLARYELPAETLVGWPTLGELWGVIDELELSCDRLNGMTLTVTKWKV